MGADCLSVNCPTGTETVGGFLVDLNQTRALSEHCLTLEDAAGGFHPAFPSPLCDHARNRGRGALTSGSILTYQTTMLLKGLPLC